MSEAIRAALERELHGYEIRGLKDRAAQVRAQLAKLDPATGPVEVAVAGPEETRGKLAATRKTRTGR